MIDEQKLTGLDLQLALERDAVDDTKAAWADATAEARTAEEEADTDYGVKAVRGVIDAAAAQVRVVFDGMLAGRPGRPSKIAAILRTLDPQVVAYIGLRAVVDGLSTSRDLFSVAVNLGGRVEDQMKLEAFKEQHPDLFKLTEKRLVKQSVIDRGRRRTIMNLMANRAGTHWKGWTKEQVTQLGVTVLECIAQSTRIVAFDFEVTSSKGKVKQQRMVKATDATEEFMRNAEKYMCMLHPRYTPTVVRPKRWTNVRNGGYWSGLLPLTLVKTPRGKVLEEMNNQDMPEVYAAINRMQETAWRVNGAVLDVLKEATARSITIGSLPPSDNAELPNKPFDIDTNEEAKKDWKRKAAEVHNANKKNESKRMQVTRTISIASKFLEYPTIYFPYQMDFRGRAYAVPMFLNPQGPDYCKALLTFSEGKPINDGVAAGWLAIHGANLFGVDKVSLDDRIKWVQENEDAIQRTAQDPWDNLSFWTGADKPWQFLAFCFEWTAFKVVGYGYLSSLPIALDGSCNGLQHYSAALRDSIGGKATNLTPSDTPSDIYAEVAKVCISTVMPLVQAGADPGSPAWFAAKWMEFGIDRKITKRAVMTLPYGSTIFSCREFIDEAIRSKLSAARTNVFMHRKEITKADGTTEWVDTDGVFDASLFLQSHVWKAIGCVVKAAVDAMGWLRECSKLASGENLPVIWTLPDGFMVSQIYPQQTYQRIKTVLEGEHVQFRHWTDGSELDKRRMANGIAPNFVHSLDACALRNFVNLAYDNGIRSFGLVHDSYATVAADADKMSACIRESFAELYESNDVLEQFRTSIAAMLSDENVQKLPSVPEKGDLDISSVRESDFFFA